MKYAFLLLIFISCSGVIKSQSPNNEPLKFIEVTGSAELEIDPDEIRLIIGLEEYWKEEFDKKTEFKDYKTKIQIAEIEKNLLNDLAKIGITNDKIIVREVGNYWRYTGKEFLVNKQFEVIVNDFKKIDEIIKVISTRGVGYMRIGELKNKDITEFRKKVKIEALKAAKEKADYLLKSIDRQVGNIISVIEPDEQVNYWGAQSQASNMVMATSDDTGADNFRKIKLRYEIKAKFEIK